MKIAIVGGTGNISTSIVKLLLEQGHDVTCVNRGIRGELPKDVRLIKGDRQDRKWFEEAMQKEKFDAAIDMICYTAEDAVSSLAAFRGTGHFIHTSTVVTYGSEFKWFPVTEDHPLRAENSYGKLKVECDKIFLEAYYREGFPVTILKPSTTYGPKRILRQLGLDTTWVNRIRKGKPILQLGDGKAIHHLLYVDDAAKGFVGALGKEHCIGQVYNIVNPQYTDWETYHRTAMKVLGKEVELVGVPAKILISINEEKFAMTRDIFSHNCFYCSIKIQRDIPEFKPEVSLEEGLRRSFEYIDEEGLVENSDEQTWEDRIIEAQHQVAMIRF